MCSKPREKKNKPAESELLSETAIEPHVNEEPANRAATESGIDLDALEKELDMSDNESDYKEAFSSPPSIAPASKIAKETPSIADKVGAKIQDPDIIEALEAHAARTTEVAPQKVKEVSQVHKWALKDAKSMKEHLDLHLKVLLETSQDYDENRFTDDPSNLFSWCSNLHTFLEQAKSIESHCLKIFKYMPHLKKN